MSLFISLFLSLSLSLCAFVCARVRACVCVCMCVCVLYALHVSPPPPLTPPPSSDIPGFPKGMRVRMEIAGASHTEAFKMVREIGIWILHHHCCYPTSSPPLSLCVPTVVIRCLSLPSLSFFLSFFLDARVFCPTQDASAFRSIATGGRGAAAGDRDAMRVAREDLPVATHAEKR